MRIALSGLLALATLLLGGCATDMLTQRDRALMAGRYGELEKYAAAEVPDLQRAKTAKLAPLCFAYARVKRYNKLEPCLDQLEKNVAAGDTNMTDLEAMQKQSPLMAGLAQMGSMLSGAKLEQDVTPHLWEARAELWMDLGEPRRAIEYGKRMQAAIPTQWNLERYARVHALGVLGLAYAFAGDHAGAARTAQELEKVGTLYPFLLLKTDKQVFLARIYLALGEYQRAWEMISEDDNAFSRAFADLVSGGSTLEGGSLFAFQQIQRRFMRHKSELESGRVKEAKAGYDALLKDPATPENGDIHWIVLYDRGRIAEREGNAGEAIDFYKRAAEIIERQRSTLNTEASKIGFVGNKQKIYEDLIRLLVSRGLSAEAFDYVERSKARALVDVLAAKRDFAVAGADPQQVKTLLAAAESAEVEERALDSAEKGGRKRDLVAGARARLAAQAPELASLVAVTTLASPEIRQRLPANETLVEYYYGERELYAFVVTRDQVRVQALDGSGLAGEIQAFRRLLQGPGTDNYRAPAQHLYARLVQPLEPLIGKERLTIVAHGALHYLPFAALHDGKQFLLERFAVRMLPAASVLAFLRAGAGDKPGELLAFGNPDLGDARHDLAFAQAEAETVAAGMPKSRALLRKQATETAFRQFASSFRFLHIASHGEFDPDAPLRSALLLAGDAQNDGALTVGELYSMRVDADLVTLSACETGLGKIVSGDDVVGLTRGFLYAGASSIVASLWKVDDRATGRLMADFYAALRGGADKRQALRQAQLATLKSDPHPFFWAAFELTGSL